jgi:hypothetical protein
MKKVILLFSVLMCQSAGAQQCPPHQWCYGQPEIFGYNILANTAVEIRYASYASYPEYASYNRAVRANRACAFYGHSSATSSESSPSWDDLVAIDQDGLVTIVTASYGGNDRFSVLNCK